MTDSVLTPQLQEEALSLAYAHAVAAGAGYATSKRDFDTDGVDIQINAGGHMRPALDLQLKATTGLRTIGTGELRYDLKLRNYELLREPTQTPRLLLILDLPQDQAHWVTISPDELVLRHRAYWVNLLDQPERMATHDTSVTIDVPKPNLLTIASLQALMEQSRSGRIT